MDVNIVRMKLNRT